MRDQFKNCVMKMLKSSKLQPNRTAAGGGGGAAGENVKVIVRCRPMSKKELDMKCKEVVVVKDCAVELENPLDRLAPSKVFTFDSAYDKNSVSETIYNDICYSLVESVLEGYNGTIFAYGQTGCGKSHTMQGPDDALDPRNTDSYAQRGIIPRSFEHIFEAISVSNDVRFLALVSYLEIYNENIRDLLSNHSESQNLQLKEIPGEGVTVHNLSMHAVHNTRECEELLLLGAKNRMVGATQMNAGSSRSHSIFTISLEQIRTGGGNGEEAAIKKGKLNLVDLAGSERQTKTGATGERLKEATKINLSLSALGNVISALVDGGKNKHIPYRDSKLTRLLQDSLGGNTKTLMIACVSPAAFNYDETLSTLRYASRAKNISNKPRINEDPKDALVKEYQEEIMRLKKLLESNKVDVDPAMETQQSPAEPMMALVDHSEQLEAEREKLKAQFEAETIRLKQEHEAQKREKQELQKDMEHLKAHYEKQLELLSKKHENSEGDTNNNHLSSKPVSNEEILERIRSIKAALIGGERANDLQLKEKRYKKKMAAQRRLNALAEALSRIEQSEDRDLLKDHYTDIQQELQVKTETLRAQKQKVRSLEREITDLQAEFQLDRADYLETIRKLERNLRFHEQLMEKALPLLRKDGKYWDIEEMKRQSEWNDDIKKWKIPEDPFCKYLTLPVIEQKQMKNAFTAPGRLERSSSFTSSVSLIETVEEKEHESDFEGDEILRKKFEQKEAENIVSNYFRPKRVKELMQQHQNFGLWKDKTELKSSLNNSSWATVNRNNVLNAVNFPLNKTWNGVFSGKQIFNSLIHDQNAANQMMRPTAATPRNFAK